MKTGSFSKLLLAGLIGFSLATPDRVSGQASPKRSANILVGMHALVSANNASAATSYRLTYSNNATIPISSAYYDAWIPVPQDSSAAPVQSPNVVETIVPGQTYYILFSSGAVNYADFQIAPPPGYTVYIQAENRFVPMNSICTPNYGGGSGSYAFGFYVLPNDGAEWLSAGYSSAPKVGDVRWAISLGSLTSGASAGSLRWQSQYVTQNLLDSASLILSTQAQTLSATSATFTGTADPSGTYTPQPITDEVATYTDNMGFLRFIATNQCEIYIERTYGPNSGYTAGQVSGGYVITVYPGGTPFSWPSNDPNQKWNFGTAPYKQQYTISDPSYASTWTGSVRIQRVNVDALTQTDLWTLSSVGTAPNITTTVVQTSSARTITLSSTGSSSSRTETYTEAGGSGVSFKEIRSYQTFPWGEELVSKVDDPDVLALTTSYTYFNTSLGDGHYSKLQSVTNPDGSWLLYNYSDAFAQWGELVSVSAPWQDGPASWSAATSTNCKVVSYSYAAQVYTGYLSSTALTSAFQTLDAGSQTTIGGVTTGRQVVTPSVWNNSAYSTWLFGNAPMRTDTIQDYSSATSCQTTVRSVFHNDSDPVYNGKLYSETRPDGTKTSASYWKGTITSWLGLWWAYNATYFTPSSSSNFWVSNYFIGTSTKQDPSAVQFSTDGYSGGMPIDPVWMTPYRSYLRQTITDIYGHPAYDVTSVYTGSGFQIIKWDILSYTFDGLMDSDYSSDGGVTSNTFIDGVANSHVDPDGQNVGYTFDALMRPLTAVYNQRYGTGYVPSMGYVTESYVYDGSGHVTQTTRTSQDGSLSLVTHAAYSLGGLLLSKTDASNLTTQYSYSGGGQTVTQTNPDGSTVTTSKHRDGSAMAVSGNGAVNQYTAAVVNSDGTITTTTYAGTSSSSGGPRCSYSQTDWLGRVIVAKTPTFGSATMFDTVNSTYNSLGQLVSVAQTGKSATLYQYDGLGELQYTCLDVNNNGVIDFGGADRITQTRTQIYEDGGSNWWKRTVTSVYSTTGSGTSTTVPAVYSTGGTGNFLPIISDVRQLLNTERTEGVQQAETDSYDAFGNLTKDVVVGDSPAAVVTETRTLPDSSTPVVTVTYNGAVVSSQTAQNITTTYQYDGLYRQVGVTDPRKGQSTTAYFGASAGNGQMGQVSTQTDAAGNATSFAYGSTDGRLLSQTDALGNTVYHGYDHLGREIKTWGTGTYPVEYAFDAYGAKIAMRTFRTSTSSFGTGTWPLSDDGSDPNNPNPSSWTSGDATSWAYDSYSGLLSTKTDAAGKTVSYTYNTAGKLATRTWSRGVVTTYSYDPNTGEQTGISYSDGTPGVTYTFDRLGHGSSVVQAYSGYSLTTALQYTVPGKLSQETFDSTYFGGRQLAYQFDTSTTGALGRTTGFELGTNASPSQDQGISFGFDGYGRFSSEAVASGPAFTYGYASNSNLLSGITDSADSWSQARTWEAHRDLLTQIQTSVGSSTEGTFAYLYDALGRRTSRVETGALFARYKVAGLTDIFSYDSLSQLTGDEAFQSTNPTSPTTPVLGRNFAFQYDPIGNRTSSSVDTQAAVTYTSNSLNQIASRTVPGYYEASGFSPNGSTITVNGTALTSGQIQQDYYHDFVSANNASAPLWASASVSSSYGGSATSNTYVPQTPETYAYDLDGNLLSDGRWNYTWDAENRLLSLETYGHKSGQSTAVWTSGVPQIHVDYAYDYQGRRISRKLSTWNGSAFAVTSETRFVYENWNVVADYSVSGGTPTFFHGYAWGMDISGKRHGAGGVGGLLALITASGSAEIPIYDANGNVQGLTDRATQGITATYEYSPFGEILRESGPYALVNPFRFSSRYTDDDSHLLYYGHRYYNPTLGRFLGRDWAEEKGGFHLYAFCENDAVNYYDILGDDPGGEDGSETDTIPGDTGGGDPFENDPGSPGTGSPWFPVLTIGFGPGSSGATSGTGSGGGTSAPKQPSNPSLIPIGKTQNGDGFTLSSDVVGFNPTTGALGIIGIWNFGNSMPSGLIIQSDSWKFSVNTTSIGDTAIGGLPSNFQQQQYEAWQVQSGKVGVNVGPGTQFQTLQQLGGGDGDNITIPGFNPGTVTSGHITLTLDMVMIPGSGGIPAGWNQDLSPYSQNLSGNLYTAPTLNGWNSAIGIRRIFVLTYNPSTKKWSLSYSITSSFDTGSTLGAPTGNGVLPPGYNPTPPQKIPFIRPTPNPKPKLK